MEPALMESEAKEGENVAITALAFSENVGGLLCRARDLPPTDAMRAAHETFTPDMILAATLATLKNRLPLEDGAVYLLALYCQRIAEEIKGQGFFKSLIRRRATIRNHRKASEIWTVISPIWQAMQSAGKSQFNQFKKDFLELQPDQSS